MFSATRRACCGSSVANINARGAARFSLTSPLVIDISCLAKALANITRLLDTATQAGWSSVCTTLVTSATISFIGCIESVSPVIEVLVDNSRSWVTISQQTRSAPV